MTGHLCLFKKNFIPRQFWEQKDKTGLSQFVEHCCSFIFRFFFLIPLDDFTRKHLCKTVYIA